VNLRGLRLRAVVLLILCYLWFARPTPLLLGVGAPLAVAGLLLRAWAAGVIQKERDLATGGPYAHTRNPLYLGSLLLGTGIAIAGGQWIWPALFLAFFAAVYIPTMVSEHELLKQLFGDRYLAYAAAVPAFLPRPSPWREPGMSADGFTFTVYRRNREWEAALGALAGFALLALKGWLVAG
jgi:protein-S-isoprenylcysteine O-methyltransferase Ste14